MNLRQAFYMGRLALGLRCVCFALTIGLLNCLPTEAQTNGQIEIGQIDQTSQTEDVSAKTSRSLVVVTGAAGTDDFGALFEIWSNRLADAGREAGFQVSVLQNADEVSAKDQLQQILIGNLEADELWVVLIGHGTFDGKLAKFNLVGDDITAAELRGWLEKRDATTVVVNCAACSGPFVERLAGRNRVVISATKSGYESSFAYFGEYFTQSLTGSDYDLDKDQQTSLLESVVAASGQTAEYYKSDSRLATEHAIIEDNGDGKGTPAEWFRGVRVTRAAKDGAAPDGTQANRVFFSRNKNLASWPLEALQERNRLENEIESLRAQKSQFTEEQYYQQLQKTMLELAKLYKSVDDQQPSNDQ